jgi:hypothetical protein
LGKDWEGKKMAAIQNIKSDMAENRCARMPYSALSPHGVYVYMRHVLNRKNAKSHVSPASQPLGSNVGKYTQMQILDIIGIF